MNRPVGRPQVHVAPDNRLSTAMADAVRSGGGQVAELDAADVLVWTDAADADGLIATLDGRPRITWVQLPFAGVEPLVSALDTERHWTCGKGVYAEPVAEHALALALAALRNLDGYARARSWSKPEGVNLLGARVLLLGGGGITESLVRLLAPFDTHITVLRRSPREMVGVDSVVGSDQLMSELGRADVVVVALALTPETVGVIDAAALGAMAEHAVLVNVGRGRHVVTGDLVDALRSRTIGGAGLDVTDPEPLPDGHPLWELDNCIITPHTANTPEMGRPLLAARVAENIRRYAEGRDLLGPVDVHLGY